MSGAQHAGPPPFLLIDAGNSRIKWALVAADGMRLHAGAASHDSDFADWSTLTTPGGAWISNVAGAAVAQHLDAALNARWPGLARTTIRAVQQQCGVTNGYTTADALGSDRWAGMIGAHAAFPGEPLLIATFGTATTLEALRADGTFVGGLIAPGWSLMMRSLGEHTAQLPVLDAQNAPGSGSESGSADESGSAALFATDTKRSIAAGCALAQAGLVERAWANLQQTWAMPVRLVVSGGAAAQASTALRVPHTRHDALVLAGLALIAAQSAVHH